MSLATFLIFLSVGLDALAVALSLGIAGLPRVQWLRVGLVFAAFEGAMPIIGLLLGESASGLISEIAGYVAAVLLIIIGARAIKEAIEEEGGELSPHLSHSWPQLLLTGLTISLDEFAVGFSLGVLGQTTIYAFAYVAVQAFIITYLGLWLGQRVGEHLGERAELISGVVLVALGGLLLVDAVMGLGWF